MPEYFGILLEYDDNGSHVLKKNYRFHEFSEKISNFAADMQITHKNIGTMKRKLMISVMLLVAVAMQAQWPQPAQQDSKMTARKFTLNLTDDGKDSGVFISPTESAAEAMAAQAKISDFMIKSPLWTVIMSNSSGYVNCAAGRGTARSRGRRAASPSQSAPAQAGTAYMRPARRK